MTIFSLGVTESLNDSYTKCLFVLMYRGFVANAYLFAWVVMAMKDIMNWPVDPGGSVIQQRYWMQYFDSVENQMKIFSNPKKLQ